MDLEQQLDALLGDFSKLSSRLKHLAFDTAACGDRIMVRCSYISFRDGQPTFDDFIGMVAGHVIPFCLPRTEIRDAQKALSGSDHVTAGRIMAQLTEKAHTLFIKAKKGSHRSGEAGEIVLYILTEWLLKAPQIVSKMYLKTNSQMPVHGTDGIHARFDNETQRLFLYWGESKAHAKIATALSGALSSVKEFIVEAQDKREIEIVASHWDSEGLDASSKEAFLRYLDPYAAESNERVEVHTCLLVFDFKPPLGTIPSDAEHIFTKQARKDVENFIASIKATIKTKGLAAQRFEFFLLPVPSVQGFRDKFQGKIGWHK